MEERIAANPDDWRATRYFEKKKGSKVRTCSYCAEKGHNRRTCPKLKEATAEWTRCNALFREQVLQEMRAQGVGVGALVEIPETYVSGVGYINNHLGVITALHWENVDVQSVGKGSPHMLSARLVGKHAGKEVPLSLPVSDENKLGWGKKTRARVASVGADCAPPEGWLAGEATKARLKDVFEDDEWGSHWIYNKTGSAWVENTSSVMESARTWAKTLTQEEEVASAA